MIKRILRFIRINFDRTFSAGVWQQLLWLGVFVMVSSVMLWQFRPADGFGIWDFIELYIDQGNFQHGSNHIRDYNNLYKFIIIIVGPLFFCSALISVLTNMLNVRVEKFRSGAIAYPTSDHIVIIGYQKMVPTLIRQLCADKENRESDIIIFTSTEIDEVRRSLRSYLTAQEEKRLIFIFGKQTSQEDLEKCYIHKAKKIYLLGESEQYDHDALSIEALKQIAHICAQHKRAEPITCETLIAYQTTYALFKMNGLTKEINDHVIFAPFCFEESWAYRTFVSGKYSSVDGVNIDYKPLDREPITANSEKYVHLVIIGISKIGVALAKQAALVAHYPNFITKGIRTKITMIDINAYQEMLYLVGANEELYNESSYTYQNIENGQVVGEEQNLEIKNGTKQSYLGVEWEFIECRVECQQCQQLLKEWSIDDKQVLTVASCINFSPSSIAVGLYLPRELYESPNNVEILVNQQTTASIIGILEVEKYRNVRPFGMLDICYDLGYSSIYNQAKMVNYIYTYCYDTKGGVPDAMCDQATLDKHWLKLKPAKQWSNIYNACTVPTKLRSFGLDKLPQSEWALSESDYDLLAEMEHNRWNVEELFLAYRVPTPSERALIESDPAQYKDYYKTLFVHNDIRPFAQLTPDGSGLPVRRYDYAIVKSLKLLAPPTHQRPSREKSQT